MYRYPKGFIPQQPAQSRRIPIRRTTSSPFRENVATRIQEPQEQYSMPQASVEAKEAKQESTIRQEMKAHDVRETGANISQAETEWKIKAIQLQAEMDNFRKRQQRRAEESIEKEQERLLKLILPVADNLARALSHQEETDATSLRQGVELTYRELMRVLEGEGVTQLDSIGQSFNPEQHEAIAIVNTSTEADTVLEEVEAGYRRGEKLLRPAKVVVSA